MTMPNGISQSEVPLAESLASENCLPWPASAFMRMERAAQMADSLAMESWQTALLNYLLLFLHGTRLGTWKSFSSVAA